MARTHSWSSIATPAASRSANDVGYGGMRGITVRSSDQLGTSIVLEPPAADPAITDDERRPIAEMMAKAATATICLSTDTGRPPTRS
jgi:hypothetical protein